MSRLRVCLSVVLCLLIAGAPAAWQQPVFRGAGDIVRVFVTVTDGDGRLVTSLTQADFTVRDEGKPQPIAVFDNSPQPVRLIVMLDVSGSMEGNLPLLRAAAGQLVARLRPDDGARIGTFGHEIAISPAFTRDAAELRAGLPDAIAEDAPTPLWRAVDQAISELGNVEERPVILILSDGKDAPDRNPFTKEGRQPILTLPQITERATAQDVMIYGIGFHSRGTGQFIPRAGADLGAMMAEEWPDPGLGTAALETGGGYVEVRPYDLVSGDLHKAFARVAEELHSQYLLGFTPTVRDGKRHKIEVKVNVNGLKPRARKNYVAPAAPKS